MRFPDCKIHSMEQRSAEWHEIRKGKITGSTMGSWLAERARVRLTIPELKDILSGREIEFKKSASRTDLLSLVHGIEDFETHTETFYKARTKALARLIGSMSDCIVPDEWEVAPDGPPPRNPSLWAVWNGIRLEEDALERFHQDTGLEVEEVGFCEHYSKLSGVSPDGLIKGENVGFEGKAPLPATHAEYLLNGVLPPQYRDQVHGSMAVTGADAWWFQSYSPGSIKEVFRVKVERDEYTESIQTGLINFSEYAKSEISRLLD